MAETAPAPGRQAAAPAQLDDLMLAMDVVDTLRHGDEWAARELDEAGREATLMGRLRQIYQAQGIEVPDGVLAEGVKALKESRFTYTPPKPGLATTLALLWVWRDVVGKGLLGLLALMLAAFGIRYAVVVRPLQEQARALAQAHAAVLAQSPAAAARERADRQLAEGRAALDRGDEAAARTDLGALETLRDQVPRAYSLRIVAVASKQVRTALHRRNYYLVVEAVAPDGGVLPLPITSEEDGQTRVVTRWGVRVPEDTFLAVDRDQRDDGVIQNARLGEKRRGEPDVAYAVPVLGGTITQW